MFLYKYEVTHKFKDHKTPDFTIRKVEVEEKPKTYKCVDFEFVYPKRDKGQFSYLGEARIEKEMIGKLKTSGYANYTFAMYVFEDTEESRSKFIEAITERLDNTISSVRETLGNYVGYCDNIKRSDFCSLGR